MTLRVFDTNSPGECIFPIRCDEEDDLAKLEDVARPSHRVFLLLFIRDLLGASRCAGNQLFLHLVRHEAHDGLGLRLIVRPVKLSGETKVHELHAALSHKHHVARMEVSEFGKMM